MHAKLAEGSNTRNEIVMAASFARLAYVAASIKKAVSTRQVKTGVQDLLIISRVCTKTSGS
jgi:hypothetical protein